MTRLPIQRARVLDRAAQRWRRGDSCLAARSEGRLVAGELDGLPGVDLVIGAPKVDLTLNDTEYVNAGRAYLLIGSNALFRDGFESGLTIAWE